MPDSKRSWTPVSLPAGVKPPVGAYSPGLVAGDLVFVSGQVPVDPATGGVIGSSVEEQTRAVLANVSRVLGYAGATLADVVSVTAYLADIDDWDAILTLGIAILLFTRRTPAHASERCFVLRHARTGQ